MRKQQGEGSITSPLVITTDKQQPSYAHETNVGGRCASEYSIRANALADYTGGNQRALGDVTERESPRAGKGIDWVLPSGRMQQASREGITVPHPLLNNSLKHTHPPLHVLVCETLIQSQISSECEVQKRGCVGRPGSAHDCLRSD